MTIRALTSADVKVMPWANGRGVTRELLRRETADRRLICANMPTVNRGAVSLVETGLEHEGKREIR
eukprot:gene57891-79319_t